MNWELFDKMCRCQRQHSPKNQKESLVLSPVGKAARSGDGAAKLATRRAGSLPAAGDTHMKNFTCEVCTQWSKYNHLIHLTWNKQRYIRSIFNPTLLPFTSTNI